MSRPEDKLVKQVYRLAGRTVDGAGDTGSERELAKLLEQDRDARKAYIAFMQESTALRWKFGGFTTIKASLDHSRQDRFAFLQRFVGLKFFALAATLLVAVAALWLNREALMAGWLAGPRQEHGRLAGVDPEDGAVADDRDHSIVLEQGGAELQSGVATLTHLTNVVWDEEDDVFAELSRLQVGQTISFASGKAKLVYDAGVEVALTGPCSFEILTASSAFCREGVIAARVGKSGRGFKVETPYAQIIDLGTEFGLQVDKEIGSAEVVVFKGSVDLEYAADNSGKNRDRRRLYMGEGAQVNRSGTLSRIVSISSGQFGRNESFLNFFAERPALITGVHDNIKRHDSMKFYEIVRAGMREDALAYVDRPEHQWNGVTSAGMPEYLLGGDYVKFFNDDKVTSELEVRVTVSQPVSLFVLFDDRTEPPEWLTRQFVDTGDNIGLDIAPYTFRGKTYTWNDRVSDLRSAVGPGNSVDDILSVWRMDIESPGEVFLGPSGRNAEDLANVTMYGVVAVPPINN